MGTVMEHSVKKHGYSYGALSQGARVQSWGIYHGADYGGLWRIMADYGGSWRGGLWRIKVHGSSHGALSEGAWVQSCWIMEHWVMDHWVLWFIGRRIMELWTMDVHRRPLFTVTPVPL